MYKESSQKLKSLCNVIQSSEIKRMNTTCMRPVDVNSFIVMTLISPFFHNYVNRQNAH